MNETDTDMTTHRCKHRRKTVRQAVVTILVALIYILPSIFEIFPLSSERNLHPLIGFVLPTVCIIAFGVNYIYLVPMYVSRRASTRYFICNAVILVASVATVTATHEIFRVTDNFSREKKEICSYMSPPPTHQPPLHTARIVHFMLRDALYILLAIVLAYFTRSIGENERMRRRQAQSEANAKSFELRYLRSQLNPHFLFNTLNNIYTLTGLSTQRAQKAILDLSAMLRYLIYETGELTVAPKREIEIIRNFIELSKLRLEKSFNLAVKIVDNSSDGASIPPLILLTLVENAFKHCNKSSAGAFISIDICISADDNLWCNIENSVGDSLSVSQRKTSGIHSSINGRDESAHGIGLANIRQQLALIYGDNVTFTAARNGDKFSVALNLPLIKQPK